MYAKHTKFIAVTLTMLFALLSGFVGTGFAQPDYAQDQASMQGAEEMEITDSKLDERQDDFCSRQFRY
ncbi:MAG: hypothetical protein LC645_04075 [Geobacteraceae bacterium]|nr:hypothetical protein [Geobacteraceae bacterium]